MRNPALLVTILLLAAGSVTAQNYKIRQVTSMNGQKMESTVYVKGSRKRTEGGAIMGIGGDVADVEQCDLRRNVKISDKKRSYFIEPFDDDSDPAPTPATPRPTPSRPTPTVKGGVVTFVSNTTDTGERKQMFGMTARHIKTSLKVEASPDACMKETFNVETDGWYIDLPQFSCPVTRRPQVPQMPAQRRDGGGCRDRIQFRTSGSGKLGFALQETRTMNNGEMSFSQTLETLEFSKATLESALFEIPQGYTEAGNASDLYGRPDLSAIMGGLGQDESDGRPNRNDNRNSQSSTMSVKKRAGIVRIGVYLPTDQSSEGVSTANLQAFLISRLAGGNVEAIAVGSEAEARNALCDYVLTSDISKLKQSAASKIGGILGKVTNTDDSSTRSFDAQVDFKLVSLGDGRTVALSKAANKSSGTAAQAAEAVLTIEAQQVLSAVRK